MLALDALEGASWSVDPLDPHPPLQAAMIASIQYTLDGEWQGSALLTDAHLEQPWGALRDLLHGDSVWAKQLARGWMLVCGCGVVVVVVWGGGVYVYTHHIVYTCLYTHARRSCALYFIPLGIAEIQNTHYQYSTHTLCAPPPPGCVGTCSSSKSTGIG